MWFVSFVGDAMAKKQSGSVDVVQSGAVESEQVVVSDKLTPVKLLQHYGRYNAGETAGFPQDVADDLVDRKIAEKVDGQGNGGEA